MSTQQIILLYIINFIAVFLAYLLAIGPAGFVRAWVLKKMGDNTAAQMGLLTLDPLAHIDMFGLIALVAFGIGWGRNIPINPDFIDGKYRKLKLALAYFSDAVIHLVLALFGLFFLFFIDYGCNKANLIYLIDQSSIVQAIIKIVVSFFQLNIFLAVVCILYNGISLIAFLIDEKADQEYSEYLYYGAVLLPFILLIFFGSYLHNVLKFIVLYAYAFFFWLLG